ncbi:MAG: hypothetical protein WBF58_15170 [Xanthobacteraceae bacterium]
MLLNDGRKSGSISPSRVLASQAVQIRMMIAERFHAVLSNRAQALNRTPASALSAFMPGASFMSCSFAVRASVINVY